MTDISHPSEPSGTAARTAWSHFRLSLARGQVFRFRGLSPWMTSRLGFSGVAAREIISNEYLNRGRHRYSHQSAEDAAEFGAQQNRNQYYQRRHLDGFAVDDGLDDVIFYLLVNDKEDGHDHPGRNRGRQRHYGHYDGRQGRSDQRHQVEQSDQYAQR